LYHFPDVRSCRLLFPLSSLLHPINNAINIISDTDFAVCIILNFKVKKNEGELLLSKIGNLFQFQYFCSWFGVFFSTSNNPKIHKLPLISNSEQTKRVGMIGYGLEIIEFVKY
jgi:hypothetical protein